MENNKIKVHTIVAADINKTWDYWTLAEHIVNWNFADENWLCPTAENDLRLGGKFNYRMESLDGDQGFDFEGTYTEVEKHHKISYTLADNRHVDVLFEAVEDKTEVTEIFDPENINSAEMQETGWQAILNNFKKYAESQEQHSQNKI